MAKGSSANGPTTAREPTGSSGRAGASRNFLLLNNTRDWAATSRANARFSEESNSIEPASLLPDSTGGTAENSGDNSPTSAFCVRTRRSASSTTDSSSTPSRIRRSSGSPKQFTVGNSTSTPADSASTAASPESAATPWVMSRNATPK
ncbi:hypothetical protein D3C73_1130930 [compost metagenome]